MMNLENDEKDLEKEITGPFRDSAEASWAAGSLHEAFLDGLDEAELQRLKAKFLRAVDASQVADDMLPGRMRYAHRLSVAPGDLIQEEMHLLFNLCEYVTALRWLGFEVEEDVYDDYVDAVKQKLTDQRRLAKSVAEDLSTVHDEHHWWMSYVANL